MKIIVCQSFSAYKNAGAAKAAPASIRFSRYLFTTKFSSVYSLYLPRLM